MAFVVDPRFHPDGANDQPEGVGSLFRDIAARTPGVDYHPPTGQLGSYGRGPLGEPTFEPFHHTYVDWLVKRAQEEHGGERPRSLAAQVSGMSNTPARALGARAPNGSFQLAQSESNAWAREINKYHPPFQLFAPPPPAKTRQEFLDEAHHDEAAARSMDWYGRHLEAGGDAIDDMDIPLKEYAEDRAGLPGGSADAYGAAKTVIGIKLQEEAKWRRERARRLRMQAEHMPR